MLVVGSVWRRVREEDFVQIDTVYQNFVMGCASSGPIKDLAANGATDKVKNAMNNVMDDAAHLDFDKAQEDLKQVGEGLKDGVNDMMDAAMGKNDREDGDGGSGDEKEGEEGEEEEAGEGEGEGGLQDEGVDPEPGLDSIEPDEGADGVVIADDDAGKGGGESEPSSGGPASADASKMEEKSGT